MGLPSLLLPLETRQVVANIVSHYLFGTRYMYSPFPVCIEGALPDVKGVLSQSLLADYKQEFSRWLSLACSSSDCRTEGCLPFDFFFFLQQQFEIRPFVIDELRIILKASLSAYLPINEPILLTDERIILLRFLGALQFHTFEAQSADIKKKCVDITPSFFPPAREAVFETLEPEWQGVVLMAVLLDDFNKKIIENKSPFEQLSRLLGIKNTKGHLLDDIKILLRIHGIPMDAEETGCKRFEDSITHYLKHEESREALRETSNLLGILYGSHLLKQYKTFSTEWTPEFANSVVECLRRAKETVGISTGQIILPPSMM